MIQRTPSQKSSMEVETLCFGVFFLLREKGDFKEPLDEAMYHTRTSWKRKDDAWFFLYDSKEVAKEEAHWRHGVYYLVFRPQFYILPSVKEAKTLSCQKTKGFRVAVKSGPKSPPEIRANQLTNYKKRLTAVLAERVSPPSTKSCLLAMTCKLLYNIYVMCFFWNLVELKRPKKLESVYFLCKWANF